MLKLRSLVTTGLLCFIPAYSAFSQSNIVQQKTAQSVSFSLALQPMREALTQISQHFAVQLVYTSDLVTDLTSQPVIDAPTIVNALEQLFSQSDLTFEFVNKQTLLIVKKQPPRVIKTEQITPKIDQNKISAALATPLEYVIVTGSRLSRNQYDAPYPTQIIGNDIINNDVHTTLSDAINSYPALCEPSVSLNSFNLNNIGESFGDLYCLGSHRTLSLINGRRSVSTNEPALPNSEPGLQVDLNMLPRLMVKNIEIIGVGGAPVYGSDAIAGTVNVLLHDDFEGKKIDIQTAFSDQTGAEQVNIGGLFGSSFFDYRGHIVASYEFHKQKVLNASDRSFTQSNFEYVGITPDPLDESAPDVFFTDNATNPLLTPSGIPTPNGDNFPLFAIGENRFTNDQGQPLTFNPQGRLTPFNLGELTLDLNRTIGGDGVQSQTHQFIQLPSERHAFALNTHFDINPNLRVFSELQVYSARFESQSTGFEVVASLDTTGDPNSEFSINESFNSLPVSINSPFLHPDDAALLQDALPNQDNPVFYLHKDWSGIVDPKVNVRSNIARTILGIEGEFTYFDRDINWEIVTNHGRSQSTTTSTRLNRPRFNQALNSVIDPQTGTPICNDNRNGCIPLNILGDNQNPRAVDFVTQRFDEKGDLTQSMITASIQSHLLTLNGGKLRFLFGLEGRRESAIYTPPSDYQEPRLPISNSDINLISNFNSQRINSFSTAEAFAEVLAPILGENVIPGVEKLELEANWRGVDHNIAGDDDAWTTAIRLTLNPTWMQGRTIIRSNITESIRSPTLLELASPLTPIPTNINDPCDKDFVGSSELILQSLRRTNCSLEATLAGSAYDSQTFESQVPQLAPLSLGGTPNLTNEQARAKTAGLIYQHSGNRTFNLSVDYINIDVNKAIVLRDIQAVLNACYDSNSQDDCDDVIRISNFQLFGVQNAYQNIGQISLKAWQYALDIGFDAQSIYPTFTGSIALNLNAYRLNEFVVNEAQETQNRTGQLRFPQWQANTSISYKYNALSFRWTTLFTDNVNVRSDRSASNNVTTIDNYLIHSAYADYYINPYTRVAFSINNLSDTKPPFGLPSNEGGNTYDVVGRYYSLGVKFDF